MLVAEVMVAKAIVGLHTGRLTNRYAGRNPVRQAVQRDRLRWLQLRTGRRIGEEIDRSRPGVPALLEMHGRSHQPQPPQHEILVGGFQDRQALQDFRVGVPPSAHNGRCGLPGFSVVVEVGRRPHQAQPVQDELLIRGLQYRQVPQDLGAGVTPPACPALADLGGGRLLPMHGVDFEME
jgi:hypothetical protein